jgi:hypothetical protein
MSDHRKRPARNGRPSPPAGQTVAALLAENARLRGELEAQKCRFDRAVALAVSEINSERRRTAEALGELEAERAWADETIGAFCAFVEDFERKVKDLAADIHDLDRTVADDKAAADKGAIRRAVREARERVIDSVCEQVLRPVLEQHEKLKGRVEKLAKRGRRPGPSEPEAALEVRKLRAQGHTITAIANALGISRRTAKRWARTG